MKQLKNIELIRELLPNIKGVEAGLLIGSFARSTANPNSDIDLQVLVDKNFKVKDLKDVFELNFRENLLMICEVSSRNKVAIYLKGQPKIDIGICYELYELNRNYLGSEILDFRSSILYEKKPARFGIESYLRQLTESHKKSVTHGRLIEDLINKFIYEFESCSTMHRRSDGYQFYFFYNIALHCAIQLNQLSKGDTKFCFLPKNFIANVLDRDFQSSFYSLKGTLFLPEANQQKRELLEFFYRSIQGLVSNTFFEEIRRFCEGVFKRDFFWNFRDISCNNPRIKSGLIKRTATMTIFQNEPFFNELLDVNRIKTVIDLRDDKEVSQMSYSKDSLSLFRYVRAAFDPYKQPDWFVQNHQQGTNDEIAYRFFAIGCKDQIKTVLEAILESESGSVAIHCFAGKDRTGIVVSLLHLLVDSPMEAVYADYLASESDVKIHRLKIVLDIIEAKGGIISYLKDCGLELSQINRLKTKLLND